MERAHGTVTLNEGENGPHVADAFADFHSRLPADIRPIRFDGPAFPAHVAGVVFRRLHGFADTVHQKPSGLHAAIERPLYLPRRDAFHAAADKLDRLQPQMHGKVAVFKNRTDAHRKGFAARIAFAKAGAAGLASQSADARLIGIVAVRADRPVRPKVRFDVSESGFLVMEMRDGQNGLSHWKSPMAATLSPALGLSSVTLPLQSKHNAGWHESAVPQTLLWIPHLISPLRQPRYAWPDAADRSDE
jgi:hypothetical protein